MFFTKGAFMSGLEIFTQADQAGTVAFGALRLSNFQGWTVVS
jgi:hypothetical protein